MGNSHEKREIVITNTMILDMILTLTACRLRRMNDEELRRTVSSTQAFLDLAFGRKADR